VEGVLSNERGRRFRERSDDQHQPISLIVPIHAGDSLNFKIQGFHDVDIPAKGGKPLPFIVPNGVTGNLKDEAGSPFWFDGRPSFGPNGALFAGTPTATYDGSKRILSGLPLNGPPPLKVTFAKKGSYAFYCDIHPGMKGSVKVVGKKAKAPTKKADHKALKKEVARVLKEAKAAYHRKSPKNTVDLGRSSAHAAEILAMFPRKLTVKKGTTVRFRMPAQSFETHTATFGDDPAKPGTYNGALSDSFASPAIDSRALYPSDPGLVGVTKTLHGNGFWNSGALDAVKGAPLPSSRRVSFTEKGTFRFWCLIHPNMVGTIVVK